MHIGVIGTGPASLMAADQLISAGLRVSVFEKRRGPANKLLIAGKSGLNLAHSGSLTELVDEYHGPRSHFQKIFTEFSTNDWLGFIQHLGLEVFLGTSGRYFIKGLKAPPLLKAWLKRLQKAGVAFHYDHELVDFHTDAEDQKVYASFAKDQKQELNY